MAFVSCMLLIRAIYRPPKLFPIVMLATLSMVFRNSISMVALWSITYSVYDLVFW